MAFKYVVVCASAFLLQSVCGQYISSGSNFNGNSILDNNIYIGGNGLSNGLSLSSGNIVSGAANSGILNTGAFSSNIGSGYVNTGSLGSGIISTGSLGSGIVSSGSLGSGIVSGLNSFGTNGMSGYNVVASGPLAVTSISPIGPSGLAVASENVLEGILTVSGQLPFLSAVAFEGALPTAGSGVATCGCGNGDVSIVSEGLPQGFRY